MQVKYSSTCNTMLSKALEYDSDNFETCMAIITGCHGIGGLSLYHPSGS